MLWTLVIHGGAGMIERAQLGAPREAQDRAALHDALQQGSAILERGGSALDAVEAAVRIMEDYPGFNAGKGAVYTAEGGHELDAAIMDGATRDAGSVAGVTRTRNPVSLARAVMEQSQHVMLAGAGADAFARVAGLEQVEPSWFGTEERRNQLQRFKSADGASTGFDNDVKFGTVGAAACDSGGNVAAATSTGGLTGKAYSRVGDSPLIGAGTYADNRAGAVSATGSGEFYIRAAAAHAICARMHLLGEGPQAAADHVQDDIGALGGTGGVIVVAADGTPAWSFNTSGMYRGLARQGAEPVVAIYGDECVGAR